MTFDDNLIQEIQNTKSLADINIKIVKELLNPMVFGKKVQIKYNSPKYGIEDTDIIPLKILYENKKVYLSAYNYKYEKNSVFEFSKILKVNSISLNSADYTPAQTFNVIYEIKDEAIQSFDLKSYEKILQKNKNKILIEAQVSNEFMFIQRLLLFGRNFKIIEPDSFKDLIIQKIHLIKKRYME